MEYIRRYGNDDGASELYECADGSFVLYKDYVDIVERLKSVMALYEDGYFNLQMSEDIAKAKGEQ